MNPRPASLAGIAAVSDSLEAFGQNLRDWLHELRRFSSRHQIRAAIAEEPALLAKRFPDGRVADAWLAAYAELAATRAQIEAPHWSFSSARVAREPWFADTTGSEELRWLALRDSPLPFKRRNLYLPNREAEFPLRLRPGRPAHSAEALRRRNAERQRRYRQRRTAELRALRRALRARA
jgi:hypothetical protein